MPNTTALIYQEAKTLPEALGAEVLDFIGYLRSRHPAAPAVVDQTAKLAELEEFFSPYQRDLSHFRFDRDEARPMSAEFVDTNVVLYSLSDDVVKRRRAVMILVDRPVLSLQVLNEAAHVMRRKLGFAIPAIREMVPRWLVESR